MPLTFESLKQRQAQPAGEAPEQTVALSAFERIKQKSITAPIVKPEVPVEQSLPGEETAMIPAKPSIAPEGEAAGLGEPLKILPNALKDVGVILKEGTFGTAKRLTYDIPKAAAGLVKERGLGAVLDFEKAVPAEIVKTIWGLIPQSAKELANIDSIQKIPGEFQELARESGGYYEALKKVSKEISGSILPGLKQYTRQVDRARRSVVNHPVYEALGYLALKQVVENPTAFAEQTKEGVKTTGEFLKRTGWSKRTLMYRLSDGKVKSQKRGRDRIYPEVEIERVIYGR